MRAQPTVTLRQRGTNNTGKVEVGGAQKLFYSPTSYQSRSWLYSSY